MPEPTDPRFGVWRMRVYKSESFAGSSWVTVIPENAADSGRPKLRPRGHLRLPIVRKLRSAKGRFEMGMPTHPDTSVGRALGVCSLHHPALFGKSQALKCSTGSLAVVECGAK